MQYVCILQRLEQISSKTNLPTVGLKNKNQHLCFRSLVILLGKILRQAMYSNAVFHTAVYKKNTECGEDRMFVDLCTVLR
jgi:hypothetical protein